MHGLKVDGHRNRLQKPKHVERPSPCLVASFQPSACRRCFGTRKRGFPRHEKTRNRLVADSFRQTAGKVREYSWSRVNANSSALSASPREKITTQLTVRGFKARSTGGGVCLTRRAQSVLTRRVLRLLAYLCVSRLCVEKNRRGVSPLRLKGGGNGKIGRKGDVGTNSGRYRIA